MLTGMLIFPAINSIAQTDTASHPVVNSPNGGSQKVLFPGAAISQYQYTQVQGSKGFGSFSPLTLFAIPLIKVNDNLFLDFAADLSVNSDGSATPGFDELVVYYRLTPWLYIYGGSFNPRYGIYNGWLDDFTNRFGTGVSPVGMGYGAENADGIGIEGAFQAGYSKIYYQLYTSNGPQVVIDSLTPLSQGNLSGQMNQSSIIDNNRNKNVGWCIGYLPFSNSNLEVNFSGAYTPQTGNTGTAYQNINNLVWAVGLNYYHLFSPIMIRAIGEYDGIQTSKFNYPIQQTDSTFTTYTYNNKYDGWFYGMTVRAAGSKNKWIKNFELAARIGALNPPSDAPWGGSSINQTTVTLTYYLNWDIPLSFEYDVLTQNGAPTQKIFSTVLFFRF